MDIKIVKAPQTYNDQKPGTSGLRKKTKIFMQKYYLHNFIQSVFNSCQADELRGSTILVSGDGRYFSKEAIQTICSIAAGNGIKRVWIGLDGLVSTPAASAIIRERENGVAYGGLILTASHNPGGIDEDFGVKFNTANGGPAPPNLTDAMFKIALTSPDIKMAELPNIDISKLGSVELVPGFTVEVIDAVEDWVKVMKRVFDFPALKRLAQRPDFKMVYDGMNGVAGPYAKRVFVEELGLPSTSLRCCDPKEDFGGGHPDPNLTHAHELVEIMKALKPQEANDKTPDFGAAGDGDCDRNMILGKGIFVSPGDSVAIIAHYAKDCIPYFKTGLKGLSRSMPTSNALDLVANNRGCKIYETPTGWKFFGNLMDAGLVNICGEESFGTGSDHIREKDGIWAVLAWMSIIAWKNRETTALFSVQQIAKEFWLEYGRIICRRYDYENVEEECGSKLMQHLRCLIINKMKIDEELASLPCNVKTIKADEFEFTDPVDGSVAKNEGIRMYFNNGSRVVWRISGTGSSGATIRMYLESHGEKGMLENEMETRLSETIKLALHVSQINSITGRDGPTVIT